VTKCQLCEKERVTDCNWCGVDRCEDHYIDAEEGNFCSDECQIAYTAWDHQRTLDGKGGAL